MLSPVMCLVRAWWPLALLQLTEHEPQLDQELTRQTLQVASSTPSLVQYCAPPQTARLQLLLLVFFPPLQELHLSQGDQ